MPGINQLGPKSAVKTRRGALGGPGYGQVVAAPTIGAKAFAPMKSTQIRDWITRKKMVDSTEQEVKRALVKYRPRPHIQQVLGSKAFVDKLIKEISHSKRHDDKTELVKVRSTREVLNHLSQAIDNLIDRSSIYTKAGGELTFGLRAAAAAGKGLQVDANLVSYRLLKYETDC